MRPPAPARRCRSAGGAGWSAAPRAARTRSRRWSCSGCASPRVTAARGRGRRSRPLLVRRHQAGRQRHRREVAHGDLVDGQYCTIPVHRLDERMVPRWRWLLFRLHAPRTACRAPVSICASRMANHSSCARRVVVARPPPRARRTPGRRRGRPGRSGRGRWTGRRGTRAVRHVAHEEVGDPERVEEAARAAPPRRGSSSGRGRRARRRATARVGGEGALALAAPSSTTAPSPRSSAAWAAARRTGRRWSGCARPPPARCSPRSRCRPPPWR